MKIVLATANTDKAREIIGLLGDFEVIPRPQDIPDIEETGTTLVDNARLKAIAVSKATGQVAVADDSGLEVDALGGRPGVRSSRYAGENATYKDNVQKLLSELNDSAVRTARFRTVALAYFPDGSEIIAEGVVEGRIIRQPQGHNGFGYDPVFVPDLGDGRSFAEMSEEEKNSMSHRGIAFRSLAVLLKEIGNLS